MTPQSNWESYTYVLNFNIVILSSHQNRLFIDDKIVVFCVSTRDTKSLQACA